MKKELFDRWVAALESGEYQQCRGQLYSRLGKYCCLGVLTDLVKDDYDLVRLDKGGFIEKHNSINIEDFWKSYNGALPDPLRKKLNLFGSGLPANSVENRSPLSMNDDNKSFEEIAEWLRNHEKDYVDET